MNNLDIAILQNIVEDKYVNTKVLCDELMVSTRTLRYAINRIREQLNKYNCKLNYSNMQGYHFNKQDLIKVKILLKEITEQNELITNKYQRKIYLSGQIVWNEEVDLEKVANQLYISTRSLIKDAEAVCKKNQGIKIVGNKVINKMTLEEKLRFLTNLIFKETQKSQAVTTSNLKFFFNKRLSTFAQLQMIISESSLSISNPTINYQISWLLLYICEQYNISLDNRKGIIVMLRDGLSATEYKLVLDFLLIFGVDNGQTFYNQQVRDFLEELEKYYQYNMSDHLELAELEKKIEAIKIQVNNKIEFKFTSTKRYIRLYPYSFAISQQLFDSVLGKQEYSRDQVAYITDSIQKILFESVNSKAILFVIDGDEQVAKSYSEWILSKYTKNVFIQITQFDNYIHNSTGYGDNIAFIINCTEQRIKSKCAALNIGSILSIESLNKIDKMLSVENGNYKFFQQFLSQRMLKVYLNPTCFESVLQNSAKYLEKNGYIDDADNYLQNCLERENVGTTYIGYKTMISHPLEHYANNNVLFITVLSVPIIIEENEVQLIINCAFKNEIEFDLSRLFELIMKMIENKQSLDNIISSLSEMELLINIRNAVIKI